MSFELFYPSTWPSTLAEKLPRARYLTVHRAPVPYIGVRRRGTPFWCKAWVGVPFPLNPNADYEVRNIADPNIDSVTTPGPTVASVVWQMRDTICILSDEPHQGGEIGFAYAITKIQAAALTIQWVRFTAADYVAALAQSAGVITWAGLYGFEPELEVAGAGAGVHTNGAVKAINNQTVDVVLARTAAVESASNRWLGRGAIDYIAFPVTTTPTVYFAVVGRML